jgi:glycosyltransferase involved in cell wall biosynthesis
MKIALVHDHLVQDGGAERVLTALQSLYPEAPTYVLFHDKEKANPAFAKKDIRTSFLQKIPGGVAHYQWFLPFMPHAVESLDLSAYDIVISSSSGFSKGVITGEHAVHVCYCHTPTRYLWSDTHTYLADLKRGRLVKSVVRALLPRLRLWDKTAADRVDHFIANSQAVSKRIAKYYRRASDVIYPPVEIEKFSVSQKPGEYYLIGGRVAHYKRFDIAVDTFSRLGLPLKVFGTGPALDALRRRAKSSVEFVGAVNDAEKAELFKNCIAFLNPQEEDFGITAVEAMACGRPVIAYGAGGALETVLPGVTGEFIDEQNWETLGDKILDFKPEHYDAATIRAHAERFSTENFQRNIKDFVAKRMDEIKKNVEHRT